MPLVRIRLRENAARLVASLERFPRQMSEGIASAMNRENAFTVGHISRRRLTGKGPFPPSQHRLGVVTNVLRRSLRANRAIVSGNTVISSIGTNVKYAGVHEFGFQGQVSVRAHQRRSPRSDRFRIRGAVISRTAALRAGASPTSRRQVSSGVSRVRAHTRKMDIPARAPISTGVAERRTRYAEAISQAVVETWNQER